jgi:putative transposase
VAEAFPLQRGETYHVFNRGNNREHIFLEDSNYRHFLELYAKHIHPIVDTYVYCLLPNHFHFLVYIRDLTGSENLSGMRTPSQSFSNLFNAYARSFNSTYNRSGTLFQRPFGRVLISSDTHLAYMITYIHQNPQRHGLIDDFSSWPYSSYLALASDRHTRLMREEVLAWFGSLHGFVDAHRSEADAEILSRLAPRDEDE